MVAGKIAYFDCFAGAGGDMIVAALLDAGAPFDQLQKQLAGLGLSVPGLLVEKVNRGGIWGTKFNVGAEGHEHSHAHGEGHTVVVAGRGPEDDRAHAGHHDAPHHRGLSQILAMIDGAGLSAVTADRAKRIFTRLGHAEAKVHNMPVEQVHFHEVGAADSIMDIVGACIAIELLSVAEVRCSPIPVGSGTVAMAHGIFPIPAPATAELLKGVPVAASGASGELTTPTAAAVLSTLCSVFGPLPSMLVKSIGYGAGTRSQEGYPNLLRVFLGEPTADDSADSVVELSANIDDCSGEIIGATLEKLISSGCLDAWASPIVMKKSRPAWTLCALCLPQDVPAAEHIIFSETTTFGIRRNNLQRTKLQRRHETVETPFGPIRIKIGSTVSSLSGGQRGEQVLTASPEFGDCQQAAISHNASLREVIQAAMIEYVARASRP
jgi:uncharacterized protein (TIGR00299 family) protein